MFHAQRGGNLRPLGRRDRQANSWAPRYPDPAGFLTPALRLAAGTGRRLWIPELGAVRLPADRSGAGRGAWITAVAAVLRAAGCAAVSWWDATSRTGHDLRLTDGPSRQAWTAVLAAAPSAVPTRVVAVRSGR